MNLWPRDTSVSSLSDFPILNYLKHSVNIISHCSELDESKVSDATGSNGSCYDISWQGKQQQQQQQEAVKVPNLIGSYKFLT